mgnify:CR=1 FL=1
MRLHFHSVSATGARKIRRFVENQRMVGRNVVIIIDEGQCLSIDEFDAWGPTRKTLRAGLEVRFLMLAGAEMNSIHFQAASLFSEPEKITRWSPAIVVAQRASVGSGATAAPCTP